MAVTYPTQRRAFSVEESWPGSPLFADAAKSIADWQNYTYNADLPVSPADSKFYGTAAGFAWQPSAANDISPSPNRTVSATTTPKQMLCACYVPPPRIPTSGVRLWAWVKLGGTDSVGAIDVISTATGATYSAAVTYAACGNVTTGAWIQIDGAAQPGDLLQVWLTRTSGSSITVASLSGYHKAATLWGGSFSAISQAYLADDYPLSSFAVRWLLSTCNRFQAQRAPLQFLATYLGEWATTSSLTTMLGHYKILKGEGVTSLRAAVYSSTGGVGTLMFAVDGALAATVTNPAAGWSEVSLPVTGGTAADAVVVTVSWDQSVAVPFALQSVSVWEETATLTLPGSETVPAAFVGNDNGAMRSGQPVTKAQWKRMVENQVWLWAKRGLRSLVCDSRWTSCGQPIDHGAPGADHESQGVRRFHFADGAGVPRFIEHFHGWHWWAQTPNPHAGYVWVDESGQKAAAATATRVFLGSAGMTFDASWPTFTLADGTQFSGRYGYASSAKTSPPWVLAAAQTQDYEAWVKRVDYATDLAETRMCGLIIEQMPKNQTAGTRV